MKDLLLEQSHGGFNSKSVCLLAGNQATRAGIFEKLKLIAAKSEKKRFETFIFFFSGHGGRGNSTASGIECFLVPHGYISQRHGETCLSGGMLRTLLGAIKCDRIVAIFDCCHAGGIKNPLSFPKAAIPSELLKNWTNKGAVVLLASSHEDEYSYVDGKHSIFTQAFLDGVRQHHRYRILDLVLFLFEEVAKRSKNRQHPFLTRATDVGSNFPLFHRGNLEGKEKSKDIPPDSSMFLDQIQSLKHQRITRALLDLNSEADIYQSKLRMLREELAVQIDPSMRFKLLSDITKQEKRLLELDMEIEELTLKLKQP